MKQNLQNFNHVDCDIRDRKSLLSVVENTKPNAIVRTAAQPSHDKAAQIPFDDFDTNAVGTFNLLEAARQYCKESPLSIYLPIKFMEILQIISHLLS